LSTGNIHHPDIAFIGAGRLAQGLALAFVKSGIPVAAVSSRSPASARQLTSRVPSAKVLDSQSAADAAEVVFITVPDDAIAQVAGQIRWKPGVSVVHCSGATEVSALAAAQSQGALVGGFHPMQAFTDPEAAAASLPGCTVAIEADEPLLSTLRDMASRIGCRPIQLPPGSRARYHASGNYAAAFINVMLREGATIWKSFGQSEQDAVNALLPLLKGIIASIEKEGLAKGMPGPISRGDVGTVSKHAQALAQVDPATLALYRELALRAIPLALERGSIDTTRAAELEKVLRNT
jgi:predicted short-subunit dehydrogenase-like oxidoreductase (DUF2520 family)